MWLLYMSGSINSFDDNRIAIHQVLGVVPEPSGASHMPPTRKLGRLSCSGFSSELAGEPIEPVDEHIVELNQDRCVR